MAYTTPKTFTNEPLIASDLNTFISDNLDALKNPPSAVYNANEGTDLSLGSTTLADMDATEGKLQHTITTTGGDVLVMLRASGSVAVGNNNLFLDVSVDGAAQSTALGAADGLYAVRFQDAAGAIDGNFVFQHWITDLAAGSHVIKMRYKVTTGANTITLYRGAGTAGGDVSLQFIVRECS